MQHFAPQQPRRRARHVAPTAPVALKKTHLQILSTVLHTCLLDGDYARAARAWGLVLRTPLTAGRPIDVRNHSRWGIGAELLLQSHPGGFTPHGFQRARDYYERLIVQHPYRRIQPAATDERTFYPAMLALCILDVCQASQQARAGVQGHASRSPSCESVQGSAAEEVEAREEALRADELARAMEIVDRLDRLVASPPFDKQVSLLLLRGHVSLWISDLIIGKAASDEDWDTDTTHQGGGHTPLVPTDQRQRLANGLHELQQAHSFFERAASSGAPGLAPTMASIDIRLREITRRCQQPSGLGDDDPSSHLATSQDTTLDSIQSDSVQSEPE